MKKLLFLLLLITISISIGYGFLTYFQQEKQIKKPLIIKEKEFVKLKNEEYIENLNDVLLIKSKKSINIQSELNNVLVDKVYIENGQFVKKGDILFTLNCDNYIYNLEQVKLDLKIKKENINLLKNEILSLKNELNVFKEELKDININKKLILKEPELNILKNEYQKLLNEIENYQKDINKCIYKAPFDGYITNKNIEEKTLVNSEIATLYSNQVETILQTNKILKINQEIKINNFFNGYIYKKDFFSNNNIDINYYIDIPNYDIEKYGINIYLPIQITVKTEKGFFIPYNLYEKHQKILIDDNKTLIINEKELIKTEKGYFLKNSSKNLWIK